MIGSVNSKLEATIPLTVRGPVQKHVVTAVIDTGYDGSLSLPQSTVKTLSLLAQPKRKVTLADGTIRHLDYYEAEVEWNGQARNIAVMCIEGQPLIGTRLLKGCKLDAHFVNGGSDRVVPL